MLACIVSALFTEKLYISLRHCKNSLILPKSGPHGSVLNLEQARILPQQCLMPMIRSSSMSQGMYLYGV